MAKIPACDNHCPVFYAISRLGDKWSLLIVRDLMFFGKRTYGEFPSSGEGIATNILANRLGQLEQEGIIDQRPDPDNGARNLYSLTDKGMALLLRMYAGTSAEVQGWLGPLSQRRIARVIVTRWWGRWRKSTTLSHDHSKQACQA